MPSQPTPNSSQHGRGARRGSAPTVALFVRIPMEHARRLDRAAFELRVPKQSLVSELVDRYVNPDSPASLAELHSWDGGRHGDREQREDGGRRRVTVETLDQGELTVGHHSFRPRTPEVLTAEDAAELLQVDVDVVLEQARRGELPGRELGGEWRFARTALLQWLGSGTAERVAQPAADRRGGSLDVPSRDAKG